MRKSISVIKDENGNVLKTFTIPAGYTSVTTDLPGSGTYYFIQLDDGTEKKIIVEKPPSPFYGGLKFM